jgi:hypothetical protein
MIRSGDLKHLQRLSPDEVRAYLHATFAKAEAGFVDFDRLMSTGLSLVQAGHEDADRAALDWLRARPGAKRLDIVAAFLTGLWDRASRRAPVPADRIDTLIRAHQGYNVHADAEYSFIQALCQVVESDLDRPTRERVAKLLQAIDLRAWSDALRHTAETRIDRAVRSL